MEMHQIRYFLAVEKSRNFTRAAEACHITQPALTRAIQKLEHEVCGALFQRLNGRIELTELGRVLLPRLEAVDREVNSARLDWQAAAGQRKQRLRLGVMCTLAPDRLATFISRVGLQIPDLEISIKEAKGSAIVAGLANDDLDIALAGIPEYPADFEVVRLFTEAYTLAVPDQHRFAGRASVALSELDGENYIERLNCEFSDHFEALHGDWPIQLNVRYRSEREDWVQSMIAAGMGIACLPQSLPICPGVSRVSLHTPVVERTISLVRLAGTYKSPAVSVFAQMVGRFHWTGAGSGSPC